MVSTQAFCTFLSNSTLTEELFLTRGMTGSGGVGGETQGLGEWVHVGTGGMEG